MRVFRLTRLAILCASGLNALMIPSSIGSLNKVSIADVNETIKDLTAGAPVSIGTQSWVHKSSNHTFNIRATQLVDPDLPHGPIWWGFPDQDILNAAATALIDCWQILFAARLALGECDQPTEAFKRYFRPHQLDWVQKRFNWVSGDDWQGPEIMEKGLEIRWRYDSEHDASQCDTVPGLLGTLGNLELIEGVTRAELVLCEALFRPGTVHSVKEVLSNNCQNIKDSATPAMLVPGSTILHEFFHWRQMLATTGGTLVKDFNMAGNPNIDPPDGYGAYNAKKVNDLHGLGHLNADSYVWFAMEEFYHTKCVDEQGGRRAIFEDPKAADWVYNFHPA